MIRARCSCGKEEIYPDSLDGKEMRCRKCRQRITVTGEKIPDRHAIPWLRRLLILGVSLVLSAGVLGIAMFVHQPHFTSLAEIYEHGSRAAIQPSLDEPRIRELLQTTAEALTWTRIDAFVGAFHLKRLLAEIEWRGGLAVIQSELGEQNSIEGLEQTLRIFCVKEKEGGVAWTPVRRMTVRFVPDRGEAEAVAVFASGPSPHRYRFWLMKENGSWRIFDFENIQMSVRFSSLVGHVNRRAAKSYVVKSQDQSQDEEFQEATRLLGKNDLEGALAKLDHAKGLSPSSPYTSRIDFLRGSTLMDMNRPEEALAATDSALKARKDMPLALLLRGRILLHLGRFEESIHQVEEYIRLVGPDAVACIFVAHSSRALGTPGRADEFIRKQLLEAPDLAADLEKQESFSEFRTRPAIQDAIRQAKEKVANAEK